MTALIDTHHLHKSFGNTHAIDDLSLSVAAGEIYGLVGPDGAGKTTTLRLLCGALQSDAGQTSIATYDIARQTEQARSQIGYLAQRFSLYEDLTVLENLRFFAEVRGLPTVEWKPRCMEILEFVGLAEFVNRRAGQLSGGMKQKLGLAAALVHRPRVLLLDEPTTGVDPVTRQDFWQLIIRLAPASPLSPPGPFPLKGEGENNGNLSVLGRKAAQNARISDSSSEGVAVLVTTPYMDEASRCHRVGFMRRGKLLLEGTPAELRTRLNGQIVEVRGQPLPLMRQVARAEADVEDVQMFGDRLHLRIKAGAIASVITRLREQIPARGGSLTQLREIPPQLEDVFISLLEDGS
jgi:ABC-2 type transport system ATP-binding protein